jgi:hypothetical protein
LGRAATKPVIAIRPFAADDEARVLELLGATLGGGPAGRRPPEFFRWKHLDNPFGPSFMLVAESEGRLIGLRSFMRWRLQAAGRHWEAARAVDTATHPDYQGLGVFSRLTLAALEALQGQVDLVFNTPNGASRPGYLKMGWREVGRVPVGIRIRRPIRFIRGFRGSDLRLPSRPSVAAQPAAQLLEQGEEVQELLAAAGLNDDHLRTPRDVDYLRWRYGAAPLLDYAAVAEREGGRLRGLAVFRVRPRAALWEATVAELLVPAGDWHTARRLLRGIANVAPVDHLTLDTRAATAARIRYLRAPGGIAFVVNPLRDGIAPDPTTLRAWALSLGDLEVF